MKIYIIGPSFKTQGGISSVLKLYRTYYEDVFDLRFIPSYSGFGRLKDLFYFLLSVIRVFFLCITQKDPLFHIHMASKGSFLRKSIIAAICRTFHKKHILHIHGAMFDSFMENSTSQKKEKIIRTLNAADRVVVLSEKWKQFFMKFIPKEKLRVIYNPTPSISHSYVQRTNHRPIMLFMGRLGERKGVYDLLKAIKRAKVNNFELHMYGDGEVEKVRKLVETEGLTGVIRINDWVEHDKVGAIYEQADFLVLPSYAEGLPMSILEAIGKGLPVISTDVGGIAEAVVDGENGFINLPGDIDGLSKCIERLVEDSSLREKMGKASLSIAEDRFSIDSIRKQLETLYIETGREVQSI